MTRCFSDEADWTGGSAAIMDDLNLTKKKKSLIVRNRLARPVQQCVHLTDGSGTTNGTRVKSLRETIWRPLTSQNCRIFRYRTSTVKGVIRMLANMPVPKKKNGGSEGENYFRYHGNASRWRPSGFLKMFEEF